MKLKHKILLVIQYLLMFIISLVSNRFIEMLIIYPLLFIFRSKYEKTYHAKTFIQCNFQTLLLFLVICLIALPIHISILFTIILSLFTTDILFYIQDYVDLKKVKRFKIYKGMDKDILISKCNMYDLTDVEIKVLTMYYCDGLKRWQIGNVLNYSEDNISKIKAKALGKLS